MVWSRHAFTVFAECTLAHVGVYVLCVVFVTCMDHHTDQTVQLIVEPARGMQVG